MTYLVLARHGETVWHAENRYAGVSDVELTARGREQALGLASWSKTARLSAVLASPLQRARQTAQFSSDATGLPVQVDERIRELDFGAAEGLTASEMDQQFPKARAAFRDDPVGAHLPGGEDPVAAADRFVAALRDLTVQHPEGRVLVVAHTTAIRLALCQLLGLPLSSYRRVFPFLRNCALTEIRLNGELDEPALLQFNTPVGEPTPT